MYKTWKRTETGKRVEIKKLERKQGKRRKESRKLNVTVRQTRLDKAGMEKREVERESISNAIYI